MARRYPQFPNDSNDLISETILKIWNIIGRRYMFLGLDLANMNVTNILSAAVTGFQTGESGHSIRI